MRQEDTNEHPAAGRPGDLSSESEAASVVRQEEEASVGAETRQVGSVRVRKRVEHDEVHDVVPRAVEVFDEVERTGPNEQDSGEVEVLPDGSVSVPILEEELVISKRTVVRERVVIRKRTETREERVQTEVRRERVELETDAGVDLEREP